MGAVLRARERPGAFAPLEHFAGGKISPQGGFTPPEDIKKRGPRQRLRWWGGTAPPWLRRRQSPPPRRWLRKADPKCKTAAPTGAAVFMGAVLRARERPGAFAPLEHFAGGKISPQGGFTPPEDIKKRGPRQRLRWWGGTAPLWLRRRQSPPPRRWPRKADPKRKTAAPNGAAVFMGAVLRARERPGAFAPLEHFAEGKISPLFRRLPEPAGAFRRAAARLEWNQMPRKPCCARIPASEARTFAPRSGAKVTAFLQAVGKVLGLF